MKQVLRMELNSDEPVELFEKAAYIPRRTGVINDGTLAGLTLNEMENAVNELANIVVSDVIESSGSKKGDWEIVKSNLVTGEPDTGDECVEAGVRCLAGDIKTNLSSLVYACHQHFLTRFADCRDTLYPFTISVYDRNAYCSMLDQCFFNKNLAMCDNIQKGFKGQFCSAAQRGVLTHKTDDIVFMFGYVF
jgi:hypothetical protein